MVKPKTKKNITMEYHNIKHARAGVNGQITRLQGKVVQVIATEDPIQIISMLRSMEYFLNKIDSLDERMLTVVEDRDFDQEVESSATYRVHVMSTIKTLRLI